MMISNIFIIRSFLLFLLFSSSTLLLEAASPNFQPAPLRNHEMLLEASRSGIQEVKIVARTKLSSSDIKKPQIRTLYRHKFWKVDGKTYDIPIRYNAKVKRIIRRLTTKKRKQVIKGMRLSGKYMPMILKMLHEDDINRMKKIKSYKGIRHASGHKVRGQRTYSNGRRGLALGVSKRKGV